MRILHRALPVMLAFCSGFSHAEEVRAEKEGKQVVFRTGEKEILRYQGEAGEFPRPGIREIFRRGGYIPSLLTPAGKQVLDDFPPAHIHHHGIWTSWTKTEFEGRKPDFWNMGQGTGRGDFTALDEVWNRGTAAGFRARHQHTDLTATPPAAALLETWEVTVMADQKRHMLDLQVTHSCAGDSVLKLPEYHYGGLGLRGSRQWEGADKCRFLTASGLTDRKKVNTSREKWCWIGGEVDGAVCGIVILDSPANFRAPQPVRANPVEPFFCYAPQQAGPMEIAPGKPLVSSWRIIAIDGEPDAALIESWWQEFAAGKKAETEK